MVHGEYQDIPVEERPLPSHISMAGGGVMVRREKPICLDHPYHRDEHSRMYADLLMHRAWTSEFDFLGEAAESEDKCREMWTAEEDYCQATAEELKHMLRQSLFV